MNTGTVERCTEYEPDKNGNRVKCTDIAVYSTRAGAWCAKHDRRATLTRSPRA